LLLRRFGIRRANEIAWLLDPAVRHAGCSPGSLLNVEQIVELIAETFRRLLQQEQKEA
jgi:hypothetical protein